MLRGEIEVLDEVGLFATQTPNDRAISAGDLVDGTGVPHRNQVVSIGVLVDRIDMTMKECQHLGNQDFPSEYLQAVPNLGRQFPADRPF